MTTCTPTSAAARQRQYRRRLRENLLVASAELPHSLAESLIAYGFLSKADATDPNRRGAALVAVARRWLRGMAKND